jgi:hypothetical protein
MWVTMARFFCRWYICVVLFAMPACEVELDTQPTDGGHRGVHLQSSGTPGYKTRGESAQAAWEAPMSQNGAFHHCADRHFHGDWRWRSHPFPLRYGLPPPTCYINETTFLETHTELAEFFNAFCVLGCCSFVSNFGDFGCGTAFAPE